MTCKLHSRLDEIIRRTKTGLAQQIGRRREEMVKNNIEHLDLYQLLGFDAEEGRKIDLYQNIGRFLYKYAGTLLEGTTKVVLEEMKGGRPLWIENTISANPRRFSIDSFVGSDRKAHEIKWRDATTDGDHVTKERNKIQAIVSAGMIPVRVMYYYPNRAQARKIQDRVVAEYRRVGEAHTGGDAWAYIKEYTNFDLFDYLYKRIREVPDL